MIAARQVGRGAARVGRALLDVLLPPTCVTCEAVVDAPGRLCSACFRATSFVSEPCCAACGAPFASAASGGVDGLCGFCEARPPVFARARAALRYDGQTKRIVMPFKYGDRTEVATMLATHMARAGRVLLRECDVLVPVPLHRTRLRRRRYNQAALLARAVGRISVKPVMVDALVRTKPTVSLGTMSAVSREREMAGAIAARPSRAEMLAGARVLLIDDVMTSGATASACAGALLAVGARAVDVLVAARVADRRFDA